MAPRVGLLGGGEGGLPSVRSAVFIWSDRIRITTKRNTQILGRTIRESVIGALCCSLFVCLFVCVCLSVCLSVPNLSTFCYYFWLKLIHFLLFLLFLFLLSVLLKRKFQDTDKQAEALRSVNVTRKRNFNIKLLLLLLLFFSALSIPLFYFSAFCLLYLAWFLVETDTVPVYAKSDWSFQSRRKTVTLLWSIINLWNLCVCFGERLACLRRITTEDRRISLITAICIS